MGDVAKEGRTVLFVSHNMGAIRSLCYAGVLLESGNLTLYGPVELTVARYLQSMLPGPQDSLPLKKSCEYMRIIRVATENECGMPNSDFYSNQTVYLRIVYEVLKKPNEFRMWVRISTFDGIDVFATNDGKAVREELGSLERESGKYESVCRIPPSFLNVGNYIVNVGLGNEVIPTEPVTSFRVLEAGEFFDSYPLSFRGIVRTSFDWTVKFTGNMES